MYIVNRSTENPRHFLLYEQYVDEAALAAHAERRCSRRRSSAARCRCWSPASGRSGRSWSRRIGRSEEHHGGDDSARSWPGCTITRSPGERLRDTSTAMWSGSLSIPGIASSC